MLIALQRQWTLEIRTLGRDWWIITLRLADGSGRSTMLSFEYRTLVETVTTAYQAVLARQAAPVAGGAP